MSDSILIAGIGNIFNRDDAFGVSVVTKLAATPLPDNVRVVDFGIRGFDLVLALLEGNGLTVFVDAVKRGSPPGTLYKIEPDPSDIPDLIESGVLENAHGLDPLKVLGMAKSLGASLGRVIVIACEADTLGDDTGHIGLSESVQAAVEPAIEMIHAVIDEFNGLGMGIRIPSRKVGAK